MTLINSETPHPQGEPLTKVKVKSKPPKSNEELLANLIKRVEAQKKKIAQKKISDFQKNSKVIMNLLTDEGLTETEIEIWKLAMPKIKLALSQSTGSL